MQLSESNSGKIRLFTELGTAIFHTPSKLFSFEELVDLSLGSNTFRGFHRVDKAKKGSGEICRSVLRRSKNLIISEVNRAESELDLHRFSCSIAESLIEALRSNIRPSQLSSFNKIRKPIDIVIEHMVAMGEDFQEARDKNIDLLFLPLDSQIFQSEFVFSSLEIRALKLKRNFTFKDIDSENHYKEIQEFLKRKASSIGIKSRIFFDLEWSERFARKGLCLFDLNPPARKTHFHC